MGAFTAAFTGLPSGGGSGLTTEQAEQLAFIADRAALIASGTVTVVSPVSLNGTTIRLVAGDDYQDADGRALEFASDAWPVLTDGTVLFKLGTASKAATVTGPRTVLVELDGTDTEDLGGTTIVHELEATLLNGHKATLLRGNTTIVAQL